eukprot:scaffold1712_cov261-Pinguiococcus_pyrenoidosus.AAC.3
MIFKTSHDGPAHPLVLALHLLSCMAPTLLVLWLLRSTSTPRASCRAPSRRRRRRKGLGP